MAKKDNTTAIIEIQGAQFEVVEGMKLTVDRIIDSKRGDKLETTNVVMISNGSEVTLGKPFVDGAKVQYTVVDNKKGKKLEAFKYHAKSRYRRQWGHRDHQSVIEITKISG